MATEALELSLGSLVVGAQQYQPGWYYGTDGRRYFYDGRNWYVLTAAGLIAAGYMTAAPKQVSLTIGDKLQISISYQYSGPAVTGVIHHYVIGVYGSLGFSEKIVVETTRNLSQSLTATTITDSATLTIPSGVGSDWDDIYAKVYGGSPDLGQTLFGYENALNIVSLTPTINNFTIVDYSKV